MKHRERILAALRREEPDRIPMGVHFAATKYEEFVARTGQTDTSAYFDLDYRHVPVKAPRALPDYNRYFAGRAPDWPDMTAPGFALRPFRGSPSYFVMGPQHTALNEWGEYRVYGDDEDYHRKIYPLDGPDCTIADVEAYPLPDLTEAYRYEGIAEAIRALHGRELAAVLSWEMTIFEKAWRIRGMEALMMDFTENSALVECLMERIAERTGYLARRYAELGVDIIQFGDDIASQQGMMMSLRHWRKYIKPRMAGIIAGIKAANPAVLAFYHSDGNIESVIPELIEIGIDVLNPIQPECLDSAALKRKFGGHLAFWGGVGVQTVMPFGAPAEVRAAVRRLIADAGQGGGLVVAPAHLIERDIPWENVIAFVEAVRDYGRSDA